MKFSTLLIQRTIVLATNALATMGWLTAQRTPDEALRALRDGNLRFAGERSQPQPLGEGVRRTLARGQSPFAVIVCCADSQVPPEHLFNVGLGELYVVRTAGHAIDAEAIAGIEHAVADLDVPLCVVLGHEGCTAIGASIEQVEAPTQPRADSNPVQQLLEQLEPAVRKARQRDLGGKALHDACEEEHAHTTVATCLRRSDVLRRFTSIGKLKIAAARYHQESGEVEWLPNRPLPVEPEAPTTIPHGAIPSGTPPHVALRLLQAGHRRFLGDGKPTADLSAARRGVLASGQTPSVIVLTCADSRVVPEHLFDAGLGELFVIRSPGNTLTENALASVEQAARTLGASLLVVLGHEQCDIVQAAAAEPENHELSPNMRQLLQRIEPSVAKARGSSKGHDLVAIAARLHATRVVAEARARSPILRELEASGRFAMLASVYDLASGDLVWLKDAAAATDVALAPGKTTGHAGTHETPAEHGHAASGSIPLPVVDWDAAPAPLGESTTPAGHHGQPSAPEQHQTDHAPAAHGDHETGHGQGASADHHDHATAAEAPRSEHAAAAVAPHGAPAHAETRHADGAHDAVRSDHARDHDSATAHHEQTAAGPGTIAWTDPIVLVGLTGVASLLAAAVAALKR